MRSMFTTLTFCALSLAATAPARADVVYDSYRPGGVQWGWALTDEAETSSFEELPHGFETEGMVADYVRLADGPRFATMLEFRTANFNRDEEGRADIIVRLHEIDSGLPGAVFWSGMVDDAAFVYGQDGRTETLHPNVGLPDEFMISYELQEVAYPGGGVLLGCTGRDPSIGSGDRDLYLFDSLGQFWYTHTPDPGRPEHLELRIHAVPAPGAAALAGALTVRRRRRGAALGL